MADLLSDDSVTRAIYMAWPHIESILIQTQRDVVSPENAATIGPDILAIKRLSEMFLLFKAKGATIKDSTEK